MNPTISQTIAELQDDIYGGISSYISSSLNPPPTFQPSSGTSNSSNNVGTVNGAGTTYNGAESISLGSHVLYSQPQNVYIQPLGRRKSKQEEDEDDKKESKAISRIVGGAATMWCVYLLAKSYIARYRVRKIDTTMKKYRETNRSLYRAWKSWCAYYRSVCRRFDVAKLGAVATTGLYLYQGAMTDATFFACLVTGAWSVAMFTLYYGCWRKEEYGLFLILKGQAETTTFNETQPSSPV